MPIKRATATRDRDDEDRGRGRRRDEDEDRYAYDEDDDVDRGRRSRGRRDDDGDERDERPRARRSRDDDDDRDDDRPRGRSRRRDEEDEPDEDRPRRSRRRDEDEEDEDDRPARSRRRDDEDGDRDRDDRRSRDRSRDDDRDGDRGRDRDRGRGSDRVRDRDDAEDRPRSRVKRRERDDDGDRRDRRQGNAAPGAVNDGWAGARRTQAQSSDFAANFKIDGDGTYVIKFLDDAPYATYRLHWLERSGKKSFVCPEDPDDDQSPRCPLCDAGDKTRAQYAFNVIDLTGGAKPQVFSYDVGIRLKNKLEKINSDPRIGPLSANYFAVSRTGKGTNADTQLSPIKERDLWDDYKVEELTGDELDDLDKKGYDKSIIDVPSKTQLRQLADELTRYDDR